MNTAEYLLLDYAIEVRVSPSWLLDKRPETTLNKPAHGLHRIDLIQTLHRLFQSGDLIASDVNDDQISTIPTIQEIDEALNVPPEQRPDVVYGVTTQGGARWEAMSAPDWSRYIHELYGTYNPDPSRDPIPQEGEIITSAQKLTEQYLAEVKFYQRPICCIIPNSETWDILSPWSATYWKILPTGYRVRFLYTDEPVSIKGLNEEIYDWINKRKSWYIAIRSDL